MKIEDHYEQLQEACREHQVKELYVFGSYCTGRFNDQSDLDFMVNFDRSGFEGAFDQFMGFKEKLEAIYQRPIDLLPLKPFRNTVFQQEVENSRRLVYAA